MVTVLNSVQAICHEFGHVLAKNPKTEVMGFNVFEGESDYWSSFCAKRFINSLSEDERKMLSIEEVPIEDALDHYKTIGLGKTNILKDYLRYYLEECSSVYTSNKDTIICYLTTVGALESILAGHIYISNISGVGNIVLDDIMHGRNIPVNPYEPDKHVAETTLSDYPAFQCRFDTMFQGALCDNPLGCTRAEGYEKGVRPLCWYKP